MRSLTSKTLAVVLGMAIWPILALNGGTAEDEVPAALRKVITAFSGAYASGAAKAAAELARFPLENSVYGGPKTLSRQTFLEQFKKDPDLAKCLASQQPQKDDKRKDTWLVACDQGNNIYYFGLKSGRWYYTGTENVAE